MRNKVGKWLLWLGAGLLIIVSFIPVWILSHHSPASVNHTSAIVANQTATQNSSVTPVSTLQVTKVAQTTSTTPTPGATTIATVVTQPGATPVSATATIPSSNPTNPVVVPTNTPAPNPTTPPVVTPTPVPNATLTIDQPPDYSYGFALSGSGFTSGESVTIYWDYQQSGQFILGSATADTTGRIGFSVNPTPSGPGTFKVAAIGSKSNAFAISTVQETPQVFIKPANAAPGTQVTISGGGFGSVENVLLLFQNSSGTTTIPSPTTNNLGVFTTSFVVPSFTGAGNASIQVKGATSGITSGALFQYPLVLTVTPNSAPVGATVTIVGYHFTAYKVAELYFGPVYVKRVVLDGNGSFTLTTQVPGLTKGQTYTIGCQDVMSLAIGTVSFTVQ